MKRKIWCEENNILLPQYKNLKIDTLPKRVRCPKCKHRFKPFTRTCTGSYNTYCCIDAFLPKHKRIISEPKRNKK